MFLERHKTYKESHLHRDQLHEVQPMSGYLVEGHVRRKGIRLDQVLAYFGYNFMVLDPELRNIPR